MLRGEAVGILADGGAGHGEGGAVHRERLLVGGACARCDWLLYVHWTCGIGCVGVRRGGVCAGGAAGRDRRGGGG